MDCSTTVPVTNRQRCYLLCEGTDLLVAICKYVAPASIAQVACTCRTLRRVASADEVWKLHCPQEWRRLGVCPLPSGSVPACASYANWRSIGIAACMVPTIPPDYSDARVRRTAAALVAQGHFAQADLLLCKRCLTSEDAGVWMELCVLLMYVIQDARRARRAIMLAVQLTSPLVSSAEYFDEWDVECGGSSSSEVGVCRSPERCKALVRSFLLSWASRALSEGDEADEPARCYGPRDGSEAAGDVCVDSAKRKMHAVTERHNDNARLECRKRAAWLLSLKDTEETGIDVEQASASSSLADADEEESSRADGSDDDDELEQMEQGSSYVAAACARTSHLRASAESVAVEWMRCGCDLAQHSLERLAAGTAPLGLGGHAVLADNEASVKRDRGLLLHKALMNLSDVLIMVYREEEAVDVYSQAEDIALSLGDVSLAVHTLLKAAGLASRTDTEPASRLKSKALDVCDRVTKLVRKALADVFSSQEGVPGHGERHDAGVDKRFDGEGSQNFGIELAEYVKKRLQTFLDNGLESDVLVAAIRAIPSPESCAASGQEDMYDLLDCAQAALQIRIRVLQERGLFEPRIVGTGGKSGDDEVDRMGGVQGTNISSLGGLQAMTLGSEEAGPADCASARRKEAEGRRVDDGVRVSADGEDLIRTLKSRTRLLEAIDLLR